MRAPTGSLTWGVAQTGVAGAVADAVAEGIVSEFVLDDLVLIAAAYIYPKAADEALGRVIHRKATRSALDSGAAALPITAEVLAGRHRPTNAFSTTPEVM